MEVKNGNFQALRMLQLLITQNAPKLQPISLGIFRSDYMVDSANPRDPNATLQDDLGIKQVEINTIASSFGGLSPQVRGLHK